MVLEVRVAQTVHFCENFIKQKLKGTPANGGTGHTRPHPGVRQRVLNMHGAKRGTPASHLYRRTLQISRFFDELFFKFRHLVSIAIG